MKKRVFANVMNVILRSPDGSSIFRSRLDKIRLREILKKVSFKLKVGVTSYCFLENQAIIQLKSDHPLIVSDFVKRTCIMYVQHYFNPRYNRTGSLFQPRFISEIPSEADGELNLNRSVFYHCDNFPGCEGEFSSYQYTLSYLCGQKTSFIDSSLFSSFSAEEYRRYMNMRDPVYLPKLAYTPKDKQIYNYLLGAAKELFRCGNKSKINASDQIRIVKYLRKNRILRNKALKMSFSVLGRLAKMRL